MIHGVGVDLVGYHRFARFARDHAARLPDLFTKNERHGPVALAVAWSLKEATLKALGGLSGWDVDWRELVVGEGTVRLTGKVARHAQAIGVGTLTASTARIRGAVVATVIASKE